MQIHDLKPSTLRRHARQVGRGGKRGKTSGRGTKGQLARAGRKLRPELRDIIKKLPKLRGYRFKGVDSKTAVVNVGALEKNFSAGDTINANILRARHLVRSDARIKILSAGALTKKFTVEGLTVSTVARAKIVAAGGQIK